MRDWSNHSKWYSSGRDEERPKFDMFRRLPALFRAGRHVLLLRVVASACRSCSDLPFYGHGLQDIARGVVHLFPSSTDDNHEVVTAVLALLGAWNRKMPKTCKITVRSGAISCKFAAKTKVAVRSVSYCAILLMYEVSCTDNGVNVNDGDVRNRRSTPPGTLNIGRLHDPHTRVLVRLVFSPPVPVQHRALMELTLVLEAEQEAHSSDIEAEETRGVAAVVHEHAVVASCALAPLWIGTDDLVGHAILAERIARGVECCSG